MLRRDDDPSREGGSGSMCGLFAHLLLLRASAPLGWALGSGGHMVLVCSLLEALKVLSCACGIVGFQTSIPVHSAARAGIAGGLSHLPEQVWN